VLATGFLDLSVAATTPPPEPPKPVEPIAPAPVVPQPPAASRVWTTEDTGVTPPVVVKQDVPRVPAQIASQTRDRGLLELIIDEQGRVAAITLRSSVHPVYDPLLMAAARSWKYQPATVGGAPVKFKKLVQIVVERH
jgi:TonB family protein